MEDLSEKLTQLLSSPEGMNKIQSAMAALGGMMGEQESPPPPPVDCCTLGNVSYHVGPVRIGRLEESRCQQPTRLVATAVGWRDRQYGRIWRHADKEPN